MARMTRMNEAVQQSLARAVDWLFRQQGADGGWHSATYGQLKDGAAVTALSLYALVHLPPVLRTATQRAWSKANAFLEQGVRKRGTIASPNGTLDFPTYAAALWLIAQWTWSEVQPQDDRWQKIVEYLIAAQVAQPRGFQADSPSYGGWDFLGADDARGITTGTNVSITAHVVEALTSERHDKASGGRQPPEAIDTALRLAKAYVLRCQQPDGGFAFTCEPASLNNKAAYRDEKLTQPRSYGTATCDGVRALIACGLKSTDEPIARALAWLARHSDLEFVPGFEGLPPELGWQRGLRFYYYASLSKVLRYVPDRDIRQAALGKHLMAQQRGDGSWVNESDRMRENDPLIATALAIVALSGAV
jgi:prenyltransferase/squalene oxidase-like repeat protein